MALTQDIEQLTLVSADENEALPKGCIMTEAVRRSRLAELRPAPEAVDTLANIETDSATALKAGRPPKALFRACGCVVVGSTIVLSIPAAYILS
ncbi:hypothetical protein [Galactobacter caseinivorans]|uniref:Uncharacterized protein n=1 Tax=Galactobacter caseinivorans TaxID=2676123 RepID=A0A496PHJ5_9MICC|nr:hypothetical protein [Galactobacter caseinivorans]RKW69930.1 hypothetical protein DWQ67_10725 [Galactobacter caseinivorans]